MCIDLNLLVASSFLIAHYLSVMSMNMFKHVQQFIVPNSNETVHWHKPCGMCRILQQYSIDTSSMHVAKLVRGDQYYMHTNNMSIGYKESGTINNIQHH